jgi:hypothetical protein
METEFPFGGNEAKLILSNRPMLILQNQEGQNQNTFQKKRIRYNLKRKTNGLHM